MWDIPNNDGTREEILSLVSSKTILDLGFGTTWGSTTVLSGGGASTGSGTREIDIDATVAVINDAYASTAASTVTLDANSSGQNRLDIIEMDDGVISVIKGTPGTPALEPDRTIAADNITTVKLAIVLIKNGDTVIPQGQILDRRIFTNGYIGHRSNNTAPSSELGTLGKRYFDYESGKYYGPNVSTGGWFERAQFNGGFTCIPRNWDPTTGPPFSQSKKRTVILRRKY